MVGRLLPSNRTLIDALPGLGNATTTPVRILILGLRDTPNSVKRTRSPIPKLDRHRFAFACTASWILPTTVSLGLGSPTVAMRVSCFRRSELMFQAALFGGSFELFGQPQLLVQLLH